MNKKIFTLLASLLMLFFTAFVMNAQLPGGYNPLQYLPEGIGKGAYHLQITHYGAAHPMDYWENYPGELMRNIPANLDGAPWSATSASPSVFVSMDEKGFLHLVSADEIAANYTNLRSALWCIDVQQEVQGKVPTFSFINKEYSTYLSVDTGRWVGMNFGPSVYTPLGNIRSQRTLGVDSAFIDGNYVNWAFSRTYNTTPLERAAPLKIEIKGQPGYFMTFAYNPYSNLTGDGPIQLVRVHGDDLDPDLPGGPSDFYQRYLVFFRLVSAAPRVLSAADFNTMLGERPLDNWTTLQFDPETEPASNNLLAQPLRAVDNTVTGYTGIANGYLRLYTNAAISNFVYVTDGTAAGNYYNVAGKHYPKFATGTSGNMGTSGRGDFRFVYYPAEDSLVINVRSINHIDDGVNTDPLTYPIDGFYNMTIYNHLIVKLQDLVTADGSRVITVYDAPAHTRIHFGIGDCRIVDDRTTVPANLYLVRDHLGRYLEMPLEVGDFTPQWRYLKENEKPLKTPSSQWLITPTNSNSEYSPIRMTNREFNWVYIDFVQVYASPHLFKGTIYYNGLNGTTYGNIQGLAEIYYDATADGDGFNGSFKIVMDDPDVRALVQAGRASQLTEEQKLRQYRTNPFIGYKYISGSEANYFGYAFNYLNYGSDEYYLYTPPAAMKNPDGTPDTTMYVNKSKNYFQLEIPRPELWSTTTNSYVPENYGIGWGDGLLSLPSTRDIAALQRYYYYFQQNDYWNFAYSDDWITLDRDGRYVFADQAGINANQLRRSKFYIRFTYQPDELGPLASPINNPVPEYFTLLNRIDESDFHYLTNVVYLTILDTLRVFDWSHENYVHPGTGYGVVSASVDDWNLYVRAQTKTAGAQRVSTFAISTVTEPLYRRFDNLLVDTDCDAPAGAPRDYPRTLKIFRTNNYKVDYLYEDAHSANADNKGINFLNFENKFDHAKALVDPGFHFDAPYHNYAIYLDTAYVNRGTGHIKPQYLLVLGPEFNELTGCYTCGDYSEVQPWVFGRYLINATDSARIGGIPNATIRDNDYIWDSKWERLAFVPAIHTGDTLYILREIDYMDYIQSDDVGTKYLNIKALRKFIIDRNSRDAIYLGNNLHKDVVFSMRFYEKGNFEDFLLESETTNRDANVGRMIAPMEGGWVKIQNNEVVISRGSYRDAILEAEKWNTECADMTPEQAVGNDQIAAVKVIAGQGTVTILNAAGKQLVISNVLGQTVANTVLTSDNATFDAPKGVLVVAVEGENAVKAVVK